MAAAVRGAHWPENLSSQSRATASRVLRETARASALAARFAALGSINMFQQQFFGRFPAFPGVPQTEFGPGADDQQFLAAQIAVGQPPGFPALGRDVQKKPAPVSELLGLAVAGDGADGFFREFHASSLAAGCRQGGNRQKTGRYGAARCENRFPGDTNARTNSRARRRKSCQSRRRNDSKPSRMLQGLGGQPGTKTSTGGRRPPPSRPP